MENNILQLKKPIIIGDNTYTEIKFEFDTFTASEMLAADQQMAADGIVIANMAELSKSYLVYMTARLANINIEDFKQFPLNVASKMTGIVQNFLLAE